jgi:serine/threonine protein kinase
MWAAGITMYELLSGYHPLYEIGDDHSSLEAKLKNYVGLQYPVSFSSQAKHLLSCLLQRNISARYSAGACLSHPFITRNLNEELPLTNSEFKKEDAKSFRIEAKFRKAINALLVCGVVSKFAHQQAEISQ